MSRKTIQPKTLNDPRPRYSHGIATEGGKLLFVAGQTASDQDGNVVGKGDIKAQAEQVFKNLQVALAAAGAGLEHVVKWNIYIVQGQPIQPGFEVFQRVWGAKPNPPVITGVFVSGLAHPDFLVEVDAVAVVPQ